jgi:hypothetical protein
MTSAARCAGGQLVPWERIEDSRPRDNAESVTRHVREQRPTAGGGFETGDRVLLCGPGWLQSCTGRWTYPHAGGAAGAVRFPVEFTTQLSAYLLPDPHPDALSLADAARSSMLLLEELPARAGAALAGRPHGAEGAPAVALTGPAGCGKTTTGLAALHHLAPDVTTGPPVLTLDSSRPGAGSGGMMPTARAGLEEAGRAHAAAAERISMTTGPGVSLRGARTPVPTRIRRQRGR